MTEHPYTPRLRLRKPSADAELASLKEVVE